jgi:PhnB protein
MQIRPYITYKGECQEAIDLYTKAFKTEVSQMMRASEIPPNPDNPISIPESQKDWIVQAVVPFGDTFIRVSDCFHELNDSLSERISISIECSVDEVKHAFSTLAEDGRVATPLASTFFSPCHGIVFDKFGVMWNFVAHS